MDGGIRKQLKHLLDTIDYEGLNALLLSYPDLANEGIPFDDLNPIAAHPLHRSVRRCFFSCLHG